MKFNDASLDVQNLLKYRLIMLKHSKDDIMTEINMLSELKKVYKENNIEISNKIKKYINLRVEILNKKLREDYIIKKKEYNNLINNFKEEKTKKKSSIFAGSKFDNNEE